MRVMKFNLCHYGKVRRILGSGYLNYTPVTFYEKYQDVLWKSVASGTPSLAKTS
jgi:hypothetical protein